MRRWACGARNRRRSSGRCSSASADASCRVELGRLPDGRQRPVRQNVRFIDRGTFWVAVLVRNASSAGHALRASTPEPPNSLVRQTRAGFSPYTPCTGDCMCPWPSTPTSTKPLTLRPHTEAAVKLNYQLVSCAQRKHRPRRARARSSSATATAQVDGRRRPSRSDGARLHLQRPAGVECLPRPYSYIGLVGSFTTSPEHKPIPGSGGDMCTKTSTGGLVVHAAASSWTAPGVIPDRDHPAALPRHRQLPPRRSALGPADVTAIGCFGTPGPTTIFHDPTGTVTVATAHGTTLGGRLSAVFSGHRRFFHAYGNWRCTTRR